MQEAKIIQKQVKEEPVEPKVEDKFTLGEIATQTATVIAYDGNVISDQQALVIILNKIDRLEKHLIGN